jgi:branched-chain amino acid transport system substrate-binding protein
MRRTLIGLGSLAGVLLAVAPAGAQQPIKIGLIMPYSGQFADTAAQMDNAIKLYVKQNGDTVAGRKLEFIRRDTGGVAPDVAKRLAQELVVRDQDVLAGFILTPQTLAAAAVSAGEALVVMNATTSIITTSRRTRAPRSPLHRRTRRSAPGRTERYPEGVHDGPDYAPAHDAEGAFHRGFKEAGGEIVGSVRFPVANPDFSAFVQRAKDLNPEAIYVWVPGGVQPAAVGKALAERGIDPAKTKILGQGELTEEEALKHGRQMDRDRYHYDYNHDSAMNRDFVKAFHEANGGTRTSTASAAGTG